MKKIVTFAVVATGALALAACAKKEEAPAPEATPTAEMMTAETPAAAESVDPTSNPIGPGKTGATAPMAAETPAQ